MRNSMLCVDGTVVLRFIFIILVFPSAVFWKLMNEQMNNNLSLNFKFNNNNKFGHILFQ